MRAEMKTPGLTIRWTQSGSYLYASIFHESGLEVINIRQPISGGKRKFVADVDKMLEGVDWTKPASRLSKCEKAKKLAMDLSSKYNRVAHGV